MGTFEFYFSCYGVPLALTFILYRNQDPVGVAHLSVRYQVGAGIVIVTGFCQNNTLE